MQEKNRNQIEKEIYDLFFGDASYLTESYPTTKPKPLHGDFIPTVIPGGASKNFILFFAPKL